MLETVRRRETADAALVAVLWAVISVAISVAGQIALFLPVVSSLVIYATVEAFRFSCGTPLRGSGLWRMATLALWTAIGYATFVAGEWYLLPISLIFLGIVLFEDKRSRRPSAASDVAMAGTQSQRAIGQLLTACRVSNVTGPRYIARSGISQ